MESERKYLSDFVDDQVAIKATNQIEDSIRNLVEATSPERTVDIDISIDISMDGVSHEQVWRYIAGKTAPLPEGIKNIKRHTWEAE